MNALGWVGATLAGLLTYEALRWQALNVLRARLHRSVEVFLTRNQVELEHFRFIDRVWVRQTLMQDATLEGEAVTAAKARGLPLLIIRRRMEAWLDEIVPYFNVLSYYKLGGNIATLATNAVYELVFDSAGLERARAAVPKGAVVVYVSNHRSNADYVVLSVGAMRQVALSYAVGEWARVWPLDAMFRSFGSYFVRRGEKDPLYHRVLERYLQLVAARGLTTAFFLEGGLSRDGALREPKIGLLDYLIGLLRAEPEREIVFIPVGINYDRVLEDRNLTREAPPTLGQKLGSLGQLLVRGPSLVLAFFGRAALRSHRKLGYAAVSFGPALPLQTMMEDAARVAQLPDRERRKRIAALADSLLDAVSAVVPATPVALVSEALLAGVVDLPALMRAVRERVAGLGARPVARGRAFRRRFATAIEADVQKADLDAEIGDSEDAERLVDLALMLLRRRGLVTVQGGRVEVKDAGLLRYYANSLLPPVHRAGGR